MSLKLFFSNLKLGRWGIATWAILIFLYGILTMYLFPTMGDANESILSYLNQLPDAMKAAFGYEGIDFTTLTFTAEDFVTLEFLIVWPLLIGIYGIFSGVGIAREAERGTLDLLLAQPVKRYGVLISKYSVFIFAALLITAASLLGLFTGTMFIDDSVNMGTISLALIEAFLLALSFATVALLCSAIFLEPRKALLFAGGFMGISYIVNFMVPVLDPAFNWVRNTSLFYFYQPNEVVESNSLNGETIAVYLSVIVICFIASLVVFQKRDIT